MRLNIITTTVIFLVTKTPAQRTDRDTGAVRIDRDTGLPLWTIQVAALDESGGEVLSVSVPGEPVALTVGATVVIDGLVAIPWTQGDRSGVAYRATSIRPAAARPVKTGE